MPLDPASIALIVSRQKAAGWVQTVRGGLGVPDGTYRVSARGQLQRANLGADRGNFFFSPDEVKNEQEQVNRLVDSLGVDVNAQQARLPKRVVAGFSQFWSEWKAFYNANNGFLARHERGTSCCRAVVDVKRRRASVPRRLCRPSPFPPAFASLAIGGCRATGG